MPKLKRLSLKQRGFCKTFVEKKNATEAALENYNCSTRKMATVLGSVNLDKPMIQNEIERLMEEKNITNEVMSQKLKEGMDANVVTQYQGEANETEIPDQDKRFKWWDAAAKIKNLYPPTETLNKNLNLDIQLETMSKAELTDLLKGLLSSIKKEQLSEKKEND